MTVGPKGGGVCSVATTNLWAVTPNSAPLDSAILEDPPAIANKYVIDLLGRIAHITVPCPVIRDGALIPDDRNLHNSDIKLARLRPDTAPKAPRTMRMSRRGQLSVTDVGLAQNISLVLILQT